MVRRAFKWASAVNGPRSLGTERSTSDLVHAAHKLRLRPCPCAQPGIQGAGSQSPCHAVLALPVLTITRADGEHRSTYLYRGERPPQNDLCLIVSSELLGFCIVCSFQQRKRQKSTTQCEKVVLCMWSVMKSLLYVFGNDDYMYIQSVRGHAAQCCVNLTDSLVWICNLLL